jgi:3'-phosphoadenosine 5'-phosphosulfate sulfotransferase (PAPS reductase)/FAD synthetase
MWSRIGKAADILKAVEKGPITASEFYCVGIRKLWEQERSRQRAGAKAFKIGRRGFCSAMYSMTKAPPGLCVSGGADSMCLAYLFKRLHEENISSPLDLTAFIIDHKARHGSTAEARGVANLLRRMGTPLQTISHDHAPDRLLQESSPKSSRCSGRRMHYLPSHLTSKPRRGRSGTVY